MALGRTNAGSLVRVARPRVLNLAGQGDRDLYVMINGYWEPLVFTIQAGPAGRWTRVIDTSKNSPDDFCEPGFEVPVVSLTYLVQPRSVAVLLARRVHMSLDVTDPFL